MFSCDEQSSKFRSVIAHMTVGEYTILFDKTRKRSKVAMSERVAKTRKKKEVTDHKPKILSTNMEVLSPGSMVSIILNQLYPFF